MTPATCNRGARALFLTGGGLLKDTGSTEELPYIVRTPLNKKLKKKQLCVTKIFLVYLDSSTGPIARKQTPSNVPGTRFSLESEEGLYEV